MNHPSKVAIDPSGCFYIGDQANQRIRKFCSLTLNATTLSTDADCNGSCTGTGTANATGGNTPYSYSWSTAPIQTTQIVTGLCTGNYTVTITDATGTNITATITIAEPPALSSVVTSTNTSYAVCNGSATVNVSGGTPGYTYFWNTAPVQTNANISGLCQGSYTCIITDINGCIETKSATIDLLPLLIDCSTLEFYLPNAFSPNQDGENEVLKIYYENYTCIKTLYLILYNRWGEKVFETNDSAFIWDGKFKGKQLNSAVFIYYLETTFINGEKTTKKGSVSLIR